jgi:hypothetical protein
MDERKSYESTGYCSRQRRQSCRKITGSPCFPRSVSDTYLALKRYLRLTYNGILPVEERGSTRSKRLAPCLGPLLCRRRDIMTCPLEH